MSRYHQAPYASYSLHINLYYPRYRGHDDGTEAGLKQQKTLILDHIYFCHFFLSRIWFPFPYRI